MTKDRHILGVKPDTLFQVFKYAIYTLIVVNIIYFLREEYLAAGTRFQEGLSWDQLTDAFSQFTDSFGWFILLMVLELETYVISDEKLKGGLKWTLNAVSGVCYFFIVLAFLGYWSHMQTVFDFGPTPVPSACSFIGTGAPYAEDLYEFVPLDVGNCSGVTAPLYRHAALNIIADEDKYIELEELAITDVVNAGAWILIVVVLWIDIFLQLRGELTDKLYRWNGYGKIVLYGTLIVACVYWASLGDFMGFWDALLWILAFFFIELNLFQWHEAAPADADEADEAEDSAKAGGDAS
jgi:hypothetical protein